MENNIRMDDLGVPLFWETPISLDIFPGMHTVLALLCFDNYHIVYAPCPSVKGLCWLRVLCIADSL